MALTFFPTETEPLSLDEYMAAVLDSVDANDLGSIAESAPLLKQLGNNRHFVADLLNEQLKLWPANALAFYSVQSSVLAIGGRFSVRMNIWPLINEDDPRRHKLESNLYSYYSAHDHNFTFMTVGYFGSGYGTRMYEYDPTKVVGYVGEKVDISFLEETTLPMGKVMLYRPFRDIHIQMPPPEFSMSLNLMIGDANAATLRDQYYFDVKQGLIERYVESNSAKRVSQVEALRFVGNANSVDILWAVAGKHPCGRTRIAALESISILQPEDTERVWNFGTMDPSALVRRAAEAKLATAARARP